MNTILTATEPEMKGNYIFDSPSYTLDDIEDLKAELHHLEREFSLTGVTSEYDL